MSSRDVEAVVTFLAMDAPPARFPPQPSGMRLALMRVESIPLHYYRYLYQTVGRNWLWVERLHASDARLAADVHREGVEIFVLYANGAPAGFYELEFDRKPEANLAYFGLTSEWIGKKIGPWLLGTAISEAFSRGITRLTVNTCTLDHPSALPLYQRLGFSPVRQSKRYMTVPPDMPLPDHIAAHLPA